MFLIYGTIKTIYGGNYESFNPLNQVYVFNEMKSEWEWKTAALVLIP